MAMWIELMRSSPCTWIPATYGILVGGRHLPHVFRTCIFVANPGFCFRAVDVLSTFRRHNCSTRGPLRGVGWEALRLKLLLEECRALPVAHTGQKTLTKLVYLHQSRRHIVSISAACCGSMACPCLAVSPPFVSTVRPAPPLKCSSATASIPEAALARGVHPTVGTRLYRARADPRRQGQLDRRFVPDIHGRAGWRALAGGRRLVCRHPALLLATSVATVHLLQQPRAIVSTRH